ncbi:MAG TPA: hypothetical protein PK447_07875 [Ignavibacteria bacterium]|nr:hypothetical protein [Ignavibacteria bacterium]
MAVDDVRIKNIFDLPEAKEFEFNFEYLEDFNRHPNAVDFIFEGTQKMTISGNSVGAGNVEITNPYSLSLLIGTALTVILGIFPQLFFIIFKSTFK